MKRLIVSVLAVLCAGAAAAIEIVPEPTPGKWCGDIGRCEEYSRLHGMPLISFYGHSNCGHCVNLRAAMETPEFVDWAASRKVVMCYGMDDDDTYEFIKENGGRGLKLLPFVGVFWPKSDGSKSVKAAFIGMRSHMPVVDVDWTTAGCLIASIEKYIAGYEYIDPSSGPVALAALSREMAESRNAFVYRKFKRTVPVLTDDGLLEGLLELSTTAKNGVSVKYQGTYGKAISMKGSWSLIDLESGTVSARLSKSVGCAACGGTPVECALQLRLLAGGRIEAELDTAGLSRFPGAFRGACDAGDAEDLPRTDLCVLMGGKGYGTGTLSVSVAKGKAKVKGSLADGTSVSVTAPVLSDGDRRVIPVFKSTKRMSVGVCLVLGDSGVKSSAYFSPDEATVIPCAAEVSESAAGHGLGELLGLYGLGGRFTVEVVGIGASEVVVSRDRFELVEKEGVVGKLSYRKSDGTFSGKAVVIVAGGKSATATIKGALTPARAASDGLFGAGTAYYKDKVNGKSAVVSVPVRVCPLP